MYTLQELQEKYLKYASDHPFTQSPIELYEPIDYILGLGGKRLRPALLLMACNLYDEDISKALPAAYAIEVFHNFTLVHDDIMDAAPLRRGKPTVHHKYNLNTGILSGDAMLIYAYEYLRRIDAALLPEVLRVFNEVAIGVCEGQQFDMNFETSSTVTIPEYLKMIELKTSVLLAGALKIGALIGGSTLKDANYLSEFGLNIGIAFQLQDDILDTFGDPEKFGKKVGGDIVQNKKTYLVLKSLELADESTAKELRNLLSTTPEEEVQKIKAVTAIFNQLDIRKHANAEKEQFLAKAYENLDAVSCSNEAKKPLYDFAQFLIEREV